MPWTQNDIGKECPFCQEGNKGQITQYQSGKIGCNNWKSHPPRTPWAQTKQKAEQDLRDTSIQQAVQAKEKQHEDIMDVAQRKSKEMDLLNKRNCYATCLEVASNLIIKSTQGSADIDTLLKKVDEVTNDLFAAVMEVK